MGINIKETLHAAAQVPKKFSLNGLVNEGLLGAMKLASDMEVGLRLGGAEYVSRTTLGTVLKDLSSLRGGDFTILQGLGEFSEAANNKPVSLLQKVKEAGARLVGMEKKPSNPVLVFERITP